MATQATTTRATKAAKPKERYLLISSDCHASARTEVYRDYLDFAYRVAFDEEIAAGRGLEMKNLNPALAKIGVIGEKKTAAREATEAFKAGGWDGGWNPEVRNRELDREGVAGEVVFPSTQQPGSEMPFRSTRGGTRTKVRPDQFWAGARAHNRWLADLCAYRPERHFGVATLLKDDVEQMIGEMEWAKRAGLSGGVQVPSLTLTADQPEDFWNHPRYEPFWSACEDLDVPVHVHAGGPFPEYGATPGARWILPTECFFTGYRLFTFLMWGGVLERHPKLKVVITECSGGYVPFMLNLFDAFARDRNPEALAQVIKLKPSEYWARQCYVGASPPGGRYEIEARQAIGIRNIMWGSDYPHLEGTWPESDRRLHETFEGVPEDEVRLMAGENAVKVYGFDMKKLRPVAERIGPQVGTFNEPGSAR